MTLSDASQTRQSRILIVDDAPVIVKVFQFTLGRAGYDVRSVGTGEQALALMEEFRPDAVILDLMLPGISGFEVIQQVRGDERYGGVKILVTSGFYFGNLQEELQAVLAVADFHCTKPVGPNVLLGHLAELGVTPRFMPKVEESC
jgi:CheY-like chemotaxis protein